MVTHDFSFSSIDQWLTDWFVFYFRNDIPHSVTWRGTPLFCELR